MTPANFIYVYYSVLIRFYASTKEKNRMCELCTFSKIWSHNYVISLNLLNILSAMLTTYILLTYKGHSISFYLKYVIKDPIIF